MSYEIYYNVFFIGGLVLAGIMLVVSVLLFFLLNIPHVFGDLTGRNARKAIENIRNQNASSGDKLYKTSAVNRERGKLTDKISPFHIEVFDCGTHHRGLHDQRIFHGKIKCFN